MRARDLLAAVTVTFAALVQGKVIKLSKDADPLDHLTEEEFEEFFHEENLKDKDPEEFKKRAEALKENEKLVKEVDEKFMAGNLTYFDKINPLSDLPYDEFVKQKTGLLPDRDVEYSRGLIPLPENYSDPESEAYFDRLRYNRATLPESYSSVDEGWVTPVKDQMQCGSCVAFASMAAIETCFKKLTGVGDDYSEQQMVDCGYNYRGAGGCNGAQIYSYFEYARDKNLMFSHESQYPYLNESPKLSCPRGLPVYNRGARVSGAWSTRQGTEELLKKVVYENGAAVVAIQAGKNAGEARGGLSEYGGGVYTGCTTKNLDHAVTVVGWGREQGMDYWLIKNSWKNTWGDKGYLKLARGYNMCGIGTDIATITCEAVAGATDAPLTTKYPCKDKYNNCRDLIGSCWQPNIYEGCESTCQLCPGMTPVESYTCYDEFNNCRDYITRGVCDGENAGKCKKTCGTCPANTPVPNPTTPAPTTPYTTKRTTAYTTKRTTVPADATCTCNDFVDGNGYGKCEKTYKDMPVCYVNQPTSCPDAQETSDGSAYSFDACTGTGTTERTTARTTARPTQRPTQSPTTKTTPSPSPNPSPTPCPNPEPNPNPNPNPNPIPWNDEENFEAVKKGINIFYSNVEIHA